jgi:hypothetical protein
MPDQWKESIIIPIKKDDITGCNISCRISLLSTLYNILSNNILAQLFENRVLWRIFGPKRNGVKGGWGKLHNLYSSPSIIRIFKSRRMRWAGHVARMGEKRNVYRLLLREPEGKRPLGRPRRRWIDNIKMDLLEIGLNVVD